LDALTIENEDGEVSVRIGLRMTFYLRDPAGLETRRRLAHLADDYLEENRERLRIERTLHGKWRRPADQPFVAFLDQYYTDEESFEITLSSAARHQLADGYTFKALASSRHDVAGDPYDYAYASHTYPLEWLDSQAEAGFQTRFVALARALEPVSGYAGFSIILPTDSSRADQVKGLAYPLLMRFPGLDLDLPAVLSWNLKEDVKGAHWLTILTDAQLERLGGRDQVLSHLDDAFGIETFPGGIVVRAGPVPQLGDVNRNRIPMHYKKLGELLAPIRAKEIRTFCYIGAPDTARCKEKSQEWFARFD
jgi:hypothetical protein